MEELTFLILKNTLILPLPTKVPIINKLRNILGLKYILKHIFVFPKIIILFEKRDNISRGLLLFLYFMKDIIKIYGTSALRIFLHTTQIYFTMSINIRV